MALVKAMKSKDGQKGNVLAIGERNVGGLVGSRGTANVKKKGGRNRV